MENSVELSTLEQWFEAYESATSSARTEAERARDYVDGNQLSEEEISALKKRGQPPVKYNRIRRKVEWLKGLEVKQRTDPKAFPRSPQHQEGAEAATDAIRYVCDNQDWDYTRSEVYDNFLVEGYGAAEVVHKQNRKGEVEVVINQYPWDRLFYDPHSRKSDFSDARYKGAVIWMDEADFLAEYPDRKELVQGLYADQGLGTSDTHDDRPKRAWVDATRKRIRVVLMWYRQGEVWHWCKFVSGEKLGSGESPYTDEGGESVCPLIMQAAYVGRDNERYGIVRDMFDPQDEINKRRSKALHGINSRQTMGVKGAVDSVSDMKRELANFDGHIEVNIEAFEDAARVGIKPFELMPTNDQISAQMGMFEDAKNEIDLLGANAALAGETGESQSGRAVLARQQGGMIELASLSDKLHRFTREIYRHIWMRIKQFWTEEKWVRVTDEEYGARFVGLNRPVTLEEQLGQAAPDEAQAIAMHLQLYPGDPRLQQPVAIENNVEELDVDILIEEVPDRVTLEGEIFEALMKYGPTLPPAVLIEADPVLPAKKKEKLLEALQSAQPSPQEQAEVEKTQSEVAENMANAQRLQIEAQTPRFA
ncbi:hypothetical protein PhaeoP48_01205 [Phaeobacter inhibens]|uniref:portal protein n=1 Tax=Phaeobacter inhibens TaxID=221822 RepID=UPI000C9C624E|nr:hypothetical protein [Phaeobacter inhibens]AUR11202.1 hypothetical protein PhaeoP48_01205 [Phaeobacter inhibens]